MSEAEKSKYDPNPLPPPSDDDNGDDGTDDFPDKGKDLSDGIPEVSVAWSTPPSYNLDPPSDGDGDQKADIPATGPFKVDTSTVRTAESTILAKARTGVDSYTALRDKVRSQKDHIFGQGLQHSNDPGGSFAGGTPGANPTEDPSAFAGDDFAAIMNPLQEKVLAEIGSVLETTGEYVAAINKAGQMYAQADRTSKFPEPPPRH